MDIQEEIEKAIESGVATFEVSSPKEKFILSVKAGCRLIGILDQLFNSGRSNMVPFAAVRGSDALPGINIEGYLISPSVFQSEKQVQDGNHIYKFDYIE